MRTVEHLLAALYALRIDNALIDTDAEEMPIFDGSALPWCEGIAGAARVEQRDRRGSCASCARSASWTGIAGCPSAPDAA